MMVRSLSRVPYALAASGWLAAVACGNGSTGQETADARPSGAIDAASPVDASPPIDAPVEPEVDAGETFATCPQFIGILSPAASAFTAPDMPVELTARVTDPAGGAVDALQVRWELASTGEVLGISDVEADGRSTFTTSNLPVGHTEIRARIIGPDGPCAGSVTRQLVACGQRLIETFDATPDPDEWIVLGDAFWDARGWLEMTGVFTGKKGAIANKAALIHGGSASIRFSFATGGGTGADGFAMTILDVADEQQLRDVIGSAVNGGGLGYGISGPFGSWIGNAITAEIDTYYNTTAVGHEHTDPTMEDHVAITLDGNPGNHIAWVEVEGIQDPNYVFHSVRIDIVANHMQVFLDDAEVVDMAVPFSFHGGYIFFSGSTGALTNFHSFDDLEILHQCS